jgi:branched-chain amino acid transport system substrate-binding protein
VQTNFSNECQEARRQNVGVIMMGGSGSTLEAAANSCHDQGYDPQWVTYSLAIQDSLAGNPNLEYTVGASPTFPWMVTDGAAAEYGEALARYAPGLSTSGAASQVWTSGKLLEAASRSLPAEPTSADVLAGLRAIQGDNLGGLTTALAFGAGGPNPQAGCYFVVQVSGRAWTAPRGTECIPFG